MATENHSKLQNNVRISLCWITHKPCLILTQDDGFRNTKHKLVLQETQVLCCFYTRLACSCKTGVEFYLYPTVITALIHLIKPELIRWDWIEYGVRSNWVVTWCVVTIRRTVTYKISQAAHSRCTVVRPVQKSMGKSKIRHPVKS